MMNQVQRQWVGYQQPGPQYNWEKTLYYLGQGLKIFLSSESTFQPWCIRDGLRVGSPAPGDSYRWRRSDVMDLNLTDILNN